MTGKFRDDLTAEYLRSRLDYDSATGLFTWRFNPGAQPAWNTRRAGKPAGHAQKFHDGHIYLVIRIDGKLYLAHRLAWLHHYGEWPSRNLDHENRDRMANRIDNLRLATQAENTLNRDAQKNSLSGIKGVSRHGNRWRVRVQGHGQSVLRSFESLEEAIEWQKKMSRAIHGEFAPQSNSR